MPDSSIRIIYIVGDITDQAKRISVYFINRPTETSPLLSPSK